jgi:AraC family transcriptional regulator
MHRQRSGRWRAEDSEHISKIGKDSPAQLREDRGVKLAVADYGIDDEVAAAAAATRALDFIEAHLFEQLNVSRIAAACGVSAFHFSRRFRASHGESVMAYVQGRRLEMAARRMLDEPQTTLAAIALDCGFESHAGFTRAFTRAFGAAPKQYRQSTTPHGRKRSISMLEKVVLHASIEQVPSFKVAGIVGQFNPSNYVRIAELWKSFVAKMQFAGRLGNGETCGVFRHRDFVAQSFEHLAGARIADDSPTPDGLTIWTMPSRDYLVIKQMLVEGDLHPQVAAAQAEIWGTRIAASGRTLAKAPDFQIYPANFKVAEGGWLAYYIPVE